MSSEESHEIPPDHTWKTPEFERRLPELLEKARAGTQLFKVWKGDIPRCEIETKGSVRIGRLKYGEGDDAPVHDVWDFRLEHRSGTNFWPVLEPIVRQLGQPILLTMTGEIRRYTLSGDPVRPFVELLAWWPVGPSA